MVLALSRQFVTLTGTGKAVRVFFPGFNISGDFYQFAALFLFLRRLYFGTYADRCLLNFAEENQELFTSV